MRWLHIFGWALLLICAVTFARMLFTIEFLLNLNVPLKSPKPLAAIVAVVSSNSKAQRANEVDTSPQTLTPQSTPAPPVEAMNGVSCSFPRLNPFDPSILNHVKLPTGPIDCDKKYDHPIFFETDHGSNLVRLANPAEYGLQTCCYRSFERQNEHAVRWTHTHRDKNDDGECYPIAIEDRITPIPKEHEFIIVYCERAPPPPAKGIQKVWSWLAGESKPEESQVLIDMFAFVHAKQHIETTSTLPEDSLNVVLIGLDAVSHMNFIRTMPQSYDFLRQNLSAIGMNGYIKVGGNTFPNMLPLLTGQSVDEAEDKEHGHGCWGRSNFDKCPFIWKNYSSAGFVTAFSEDAWRIAIFNYGKRGFKAQPTDYYLRPFMMNLENKLGHNAKTKGPTNVCYGPRLGLEVLLDHVSKQLAMTTMTAPRQRTRRLFSFTWASSLTHDQLNKAHYGDENVLNFLQWFDTYKEGQLRNNTILILLSDHGMLFGSFRNTFQGYLEERLPFLYFVVPPWFEDKYPEAVQGLKTNAERLTSPYDVHETLLDLLNPERSISDHALMSHRHSESNLALGESLPRGLSLFLPVPKNRTCAGAAISQHFCVCNTMQEIANPGDDYKVATAVGIVISGLNKTLAQYPQCAQLQLSAISSAYQRVQPKEAPVDVKAKAKNPAARPSILFDLTLAVTFSVRPSDAVFEATVTEKPPMSNKWVLSGEVSRLNMYGNQSHCVDEYEMKKYCFCS